MGLGVYIIFIGLLFAGLVYFFIKHIVAPRKVDHILKMIEAGQFKKAINEAQTLVKKNERDHRAHFLLAEAYFHNKQMEEAMIEFKFLTKLHKYDDRVKEERVRNRLAEIFLHYGQLEEAQKEFLLIIRLNPSNSDILFKIATLFWERNYAENAYNYFLKVLKINQKHAASHCYAGIILYNINKDQEAVQHLTAAVKFDPMLHKASYYLGLINRKNNNLHQAVNNFTDAQKDIEFKQRARLSKGQCYFELGDVNKAIIELEGGVKDITQEDNISLAIRYSLAACYEQIRDFPSAIEQWERITTCKPGYNDVLEKLSMYQDLRTNDQMKDFLTASNTAFEQICRKMIQAMGFHIVKFNATSGNHTVILAAEQESRWRNSKVSNKLIHIFRESHPINEQTIREMQEEMKRNNANKAICITSTKFSPGARDFASARPIDLIDKSGLASILKKI